MLPVNGFAMSDDKERIRIIIITQLSDTIGGRLLSQTRSLMFQLAEVVVTRGMFDEMLERKWRLRLAPG